MPTIPMSAGERIERWISAAVEQDGCWVWTARLTTNGYATMPVGHRWTVAHRVFYEYFIADIPEGLQLDHLCRNRACVNPWHMDPVTGAVNRARGDQSRTHNSSKTHCAHGHPYDEANTIRIPSRPNARYCRECNRIRRRQSHAKSRLLRSQGGG